MSTLLLLLPTASSRGVLVVPWWGIDTERQPRDSGRSRSEMDRALMITWWLTAPRRVKS